MLGGPSVAPLMTYPGQLGYIGLFLGTLKLSYHIPGLAEKGTGGCYLILGRNISCLPGDKLRQCLYPSPVEIPTEGLEIIDPSVSHRFFLKPWRGWWIGN